MKTVETCRWLSTLRSSGSGQLAHVHALCAGMPRHVWFKWDMLDVSASATVHVDYTSAMIRRHNVFGDGLASVSLPFQHTTWRIS